VKTRCTRCGRISLPVLPGARYLPAPHVRVFEETYVAMGEHCVSRVIAPCPPDSAGFGATNLVRIQTIWDDDTMWDL